MMFFSDFNLHMYRAKSQLLMLDFLFKTSILAFILLIYFHDRNIYVFITHRCGMQKFRRDPRCFTSSREAPMEYVLHEKSIQCLYWTEANGDSSVDEASTTMNVHVRQGSLGSRCFYADVPVIYSRSFGHTWTVRSVVSRYVKLAHISWLSLPVHRFMCMRMI